MIPSVNHTNVILLTAIARTMLVDSGLLCECSEWRRTNPWDRSSPRISLLLFNWCPTRFFLPIWKLALAY